MNTITVPTDKEHIANLERAIQILVQEPFKVRKFKLIETFPGSPRKGTVVETYVNRNDHVTPFYKVIKKDKRSLFEQVFHPQLELIGKKIIENNKFWREIK